MGKAERLNIIEQLETSRHSKVVTYLTADRGLINLSVAEDIIRRLYDHLSQIGTVDEIDLFVYSRGGDTMVPWPLVNLIREYTKKFVVLVPFRAHSAATQIALGANEVVMGPMAELTPVDPTVTTPLNPANSAGPKSTHRDWFGGHHFVFGLPQGSTRDYGYE